MKRLSFLLRPAARAALCLGLTAPAFAHVVLDEPAVLAGRSYRAALRVGHGCEGQATTAIRVTIPAGFQGAKPMPKPGWNLAIKREKLAKPYTSHGRQIIEDVSEITWTAIGRENALPDAWYDEFVLRGSAPVTAGALWFKVLQSCEKGSLDWAQIPAEGSAITGLKTPAVLLEVISSEQLGHQH